MEHVASQKAETRSNREADKRRSTHAIQKKRLEKRGLEMASILSVAEKTSSTAVSSVQQCSDKDEEHYSQLLTHLKRERLTTREGLTERSVWAL